MSLDNQHIAAAYDEIAELWKNDRFNPENGVAQHKVALQFLKQGGFSLNVGCGCNSRFNALLRDAGLEIEGVDVSARMIQLAKESDVDATYYHADICRWQPPKQYDFITAWDSMWHLPLDQQAPVMSTLLSHLNVGGVFIFSAGGLDAASEHKDSSMGPEVSYSTLGIQGYLDLIEANDCVCRHVEFDQWPEVHTYFVVQKTR